MRRVDAPEVVDEDVEDAEHQDQEPCRPLRLETDGDHDARHQADDGDEHAGDAPLSTEDESDEEEDEQDAAREQEAGKMRSRA